MSKWDERFMEMATLISTWSKDQSTHVGCVVVKDRRILATGYNGFPRGCNDKSSERHLRPAKYMWTVHAETNAIYNAIRSGVPLEGSVLYCTMFPCADCAKAIVQSGIRSLVAPAPGNDERWVEHHRIATEMLIEAGIFVYRWPDHFEKLQVVLP
jgi:dCMP deaminase